MTKKIWKIIQTKKLRNSLHLSKTGKEKVKNGREEISKIIRWKTNKKILIIWPCSIDFEESVLEYAEFLKWLKQKYSDKLEIVLRFYTWKPRSTIWWKWILYNDPWKEIDLKKWIKKARKLAIKLIEEYDMNLADELLYPELSSRLWDLYSYMAIWARSTENQLHREVASWLSFPVWIKNPTSWDLKIMTNWVLASQNKSSYILERTIYETSWNILSHGILRWWSYWPNYSLENIEKSYNYFSENNLKNPSIIIDCNHDNSGKNPNKQIEIIKEVIKNVDKNYILKNFVKWFMVESYLYDWKQDLNNPDIKKGLSLTDPCIWKEKTKELIEEFYKLI